MKLNIKLLFFLTLFGLISCIYDSDIFNQNNENQFKLPTPDSIAFLTLDSCLISRNFNGITWHGCASGIANGSYCYFYPTLEFNIHSNKMLGYMPIYKLKKDTTQGILGMDLLPLKQGMYTDIVSYQNGLVDFRNFIFVGFQISEIEKLGDYRIDSTKINFIKVVSYDSIQQVIKARFKFHFYLTSINNKIYYPNLEDSILIDDGIIYGTFKK